MTENNQSELPQDEDSSDDGLWNEFETCATSVIHLYRNSNWRTLQTAAAYTTQLYKSGLECKKRSFERGYSKGRIALAREISSICRYKNRIEVADIVALLSKHDLLPAEVHRNRSSSSPRQRETPTGPSPNPAEGAGNNPNPNAVFLFQQALGPTSNPSASPHRNGLGSFLQGQVYRHRKRAHSPSSSLGGHNAFEFIKRFKRL